MPADAQPFIAYSDSEAGEEEGEGSDIEDWWGDAAQADHSEGGYMQDSSSLNDWSHSSSTSSTSSDEEEEEEEVSSSDSEEEGMLQAAAGGGSTSGAAAAAVAAGMEGLDEATRQLLLESILAGDDGVLRCAWLACCAGGS